MCSQDINIEQNKTLRRDRYVQNRVKHAIMVFKMGGIGVDYTKPFFSSIGVSNHSQPISKEVPHHSR